MLIVQTGNLMPWQPQNFAQRLLSLLEARLGLKGRKPRLRLGPRAWGEKDPALLGPQQLTLG